METLKEFWHSESMHKWISVGLFIVVLIVTYLVYKFVLGILQKKVQKTQNRVDDFVIDLLRLPTLCLLFFIILRVFSAYSFIAKTSVYPVITKASTILLILTIGWILIKVVRIMFYYLEQKVENNKKISTYAARGDMTKLKIFERIVGAAVVVITVSVCLMTFKEVRTVGISILTSAGIAGIIVGFAAQKSIASIFAGIQIALTQPISLDDQVIVEGQSGTIEEINLTYVVVKTWDEKRLILPVNYFLETPFQNWSRNSSNVLGYIFLYLDYAIPLNALRKQLDILLKDHPKWDGRVANIQVTDTHENCMVVRILMSGSDSGSNADLQADIREKMIDFINKEYPDYYSRSRTENIVTNVTDK